MLKLSIRTIFIEFIHVSDEYFPLTFKIYPSRSVIMYNREWRADFDNQNDCLDYWNIFWQTVVYFKHTEYWDPCVSLFKILHKYETHIIDLFIYSVITSINYSESIWTGLGDCMILYIIRPNLVLHYTLGVDISNRNRKLVIDKEDKYTEMRHCYFFKLKVIFWKELIIKNHHPGIILEPCLGYLLVLNSHLNSVEIHHSIQYLLQ